MTTTTERPSPTPAASDVSLDDRWWTMRHLRLVIPLGRTALYKLTRESDFPEPVTFTAGGEYYWVPAEVQAWIAARPRARRAKRTPVASHTLPEQPTLPFAPRTRRGAL